MLISAAESTLLRFSTYSQTALKKTKKNCVRTDTRMIFPSLNSAQPETLSSRLCFLLVAAPPRLLALGSVAGGSYNVTGQRGGGAGLAWSSRPELSVLDSGQNQVVERGLFREQKTRFFSV